MPQRWIPTSRRDPGYMIDGRHELGSHPHEGIHDHQAHDHHPQTTGGDSHHGHEGISAHPLAGHGCPAGGGPHPGVVGHVSPHHDPRPIREGEISMFQHRVIPDHLHQAMVHPHHDMTVHAPPLPPPPHHQQQHHSQAASHPHGNIAHNPCHNQTPGVHPHPSSHPEHGHPAPHLAHVPHHDAPLDHHPGIHSQHHQPAPHHAHVPHHDAPLDHHPGIHSQHHQPAPHPSCGTSPRDHAHHGGAHGHPAVEHEGGEASYRHHPTGMHPAHHLDHHPYHHHYPPHHHQGSYGIHTPSSHHPSLRHPNLINHHYHPFYTSHGILNPDMAYAPLSFPLHHHGYARHYPHHDLHPRGSEIDAHCDSRMGQRHFHYHPHHRYVYPMDPQEEISHHHIHSHRHHFSKEGGNFHDMLIGSHSPCHGELDRGNTHNAPHHPHPSYQHHHHGLHHQGAFHDHHHHQPNHHESQIDHVDYDSPDGAAASHHRHDHTTDHHHHPHPQHHIDEHHCGEVSIGTDATKFHVTIPLKPGFKPDDVVINVQVHGSKDLHIEFRHDHRDPRVQTSRILRHVITLPDHLDIDSLRSTLNQHGTLIIDGLIKTGTNTACHNIEVEVIEHQEGCAVDDEEGVVCKEQKGSLGESE